MPAHQRLRPYNFQSVKYSGSQAIEPNKHPDGMLLKAIRFGDLRRHGFY
jgi:hypothetical protein